MAMIFQFVVALGGAVFGAGVIYATMRNSIVKAQTDVNRIGGIVRENERKAERRWKHLLAAQIEHAATLEEAKGYAELLRQDAYRD